MDYREELVTEIRGEMEPLLRRHYHEIAKYKDIELSPDWEVYAMLEADQALRCYTARDDGVLVGYAVFFVRYNLHYQHSLQAVQDVLFIDRDHRRGMATGVRLIKEAERRLAALGVQVVYHHAKRVNRMGELLQRLGYELSDEVFAKRLNTGERNGS